MFRELWLSVVIIRSSFKNTDVHLPRLFHNLMSMRCFISLGELVQMMLIWPFASVLYMCSDIARDPYYGPYCDNLACIDLYLFSCWNRTSVLMQTALLLHSHCVHWDFSRPLKKKYVFFTFPSQNVLTGDGDGNSRANELQLFDIPPA